MSPSALLVLPTRQTAHPDSIILTLPLPLALNPVTSLPQVVASDRGTPPRKKDHILQVTVLDVNDNPPVIESPLGYNVSVNEVRAAGHPGWTVGVSDREHLFKCLPGPLASRISRVGAWPTPPQSQPSCWLLEPSIFLWEA